MHAAANNSLILTGSSSFKRFADVRAEISYGGFYQRIAAELVKGIFSTQALEGFGERLVKFAEVARAFRRHDALEQVSKLLINPAMPATLQVAGQYYRALSIHRLGRGDIEQAAGILERVAESGTPACRLQAMISLGATSIRRRDYKTASRFHIDAGRFALRHELHDVPAVIASHKNQALINSLEGNHRGALAGLENSFSLAYSVRASHPHVYFDYLNSLAVELTEAGRLEEARHASRIALASRLAPAYPEWRETYEAIKARARRASRSTVAISARAVDSSGPSRADAVDEAASPVAQSFATGNLITLRAAPRESTETATASTKSQALAQVIEFPVKARLVNRADLSQTGMIVADKLYEMFMAILQRGAVDLDLVDRLYEVFLTRKAQS